MAFSYIILVIITTTAGLKYPTKLLPTFSIISFKGLDLLYLMIALYSVTKLKAQGRTATQLTGDDEEINSFAKTHLRLIEFISIANSAIKNSILSQFLSALGLFVFGTFQIHGGFDYSVLVMLVPVLFQVFLHCFLSQCVYTLVRLRILNIFIYIWFPLLERGTQVFTLLCEVVRHEQLGKEENPVHADDDATTAGIHDNGSLANEFGDVR